VNSSGDIPSCFVGCSAEIEGCCSVPKSQFIKVSENLDDPCATVLFNNWTFAKYGAKVGCPHCLDLFSKGSSSQKHSTNCHTISGVYPSSNESEDSICSPHPSSEQLT
jgi:hypothetical protein